MARQLQDSIVMVQRAKVAAVERRSGESVGLSVAGRQGCTGVVPG